MIDVSKLRPKVDWVLVLDDQRKTELASGIILPTETGAEKVTEGSGTIISIGNGEKNRKIGLEKGLKVLYRGYLKHANKVPAEDTWPDGTEKVYFLMDSDDVFAIIAPGVAVGVFSGRPQVPEK